jgi:hypothetical protein
MESDALIRPQRKPLLSESVDRQELIAAGVCIACRRDVVGLYGVHCASCARLLSAADNKAFKGMRGEIRNSERR